MPLDLADDVRRGVRRELDTAVEIEPVDRLDQPDRADLNEILELLASVRISSGERTNERHVLLDQLLARLEVARLVVAPKQDLVVDPRHQPGRPLRELDPRAAVTLLDPHVVRHDLEHAAHRERTAVPVELGERLVAERADGRSHRIAIDGKGDREIALVVAAAEDSIERHFEVLELLEGQLETCRQPTDDEARDLVEVLLRRQDESDLVVHVGSSASRSSSRSSCSRRAAASLPACTA